MAKLEKHLKSWIVVCPRRLSREIDNFIQMIKSTGIPMGFVIDEPKK
jgi:hypothetical protein